MAKLKRTEKIKKHRTVEEELEEEGHRGVRDHFDIFPLINHKKKKKK